MGLFSPFSDVERLTLRLVLTFAAIVLAPLAILLAMRPGYLRRIDRMTREYDQTFNDAEIKSWLSSIELDEDKQFSRKEIPASIWAKGFDPSSCNSIFVRKKPRRALVDWGGGFGHWGYVVCLDEPTSATTMVQQHDVVKQVRPGIFSWVTGPD